jgi:hypothetical protein
MQKAKKRKDDGAVGIACTCGSVRLLVQTENLREGALGGAAVMMMQAVVGVASAVCGCTGFQPCKEIRK